MPKTVLYLDHTSKMGGGEIALLNLTMVLDKSRYTPVVVLATEGPLVGKLRDAGIETHVISLDKSLTDTRKETLGAGIALRIAAVGPLLAYAARLARWARTRGVDIIHCNSLKADIYGAIAGRMARLPIIWHIRDRLTDGYLPGPATVVFRRLAHILPDVVITNSESTRRCLEPISLRRTAVVYSGVAEDHVVSSMPVVHDGFSPNRVPVVHDGQDQDWFLDQAAAAASAVSVISLIGRLAPWKGQHVFIEAAAQVLQHYPRTFFRIVGSPLFGEHAYEQQIRDQVENLKIGSQVQFMGFQEDIPAILNDTDIVVHASTHGEPFGQVVVEGMAAGKPVVATDGGALPEIVEHGVTGLLTPMGDAPALADAICTLLADPAYAHALGSAGLERVRSRFTIKQTVAKVEAVYDRLLSPTKTQEQQPLSAVSS